MKIFGRWMFQNLLFIILFSLDVYNNFNYKIDLLSKEDLRVEGGILTMQEYRDSTALVVEVLTLLSFFLVALVP